MTDLSDEEILSRMKAAVPEAVVKIWDHGARLEIRSEAGVKLYDGPLFHLRDPATVDRVAAKVKERL